MVLDLMRTRRSIRRFGAGVPPRATVLEIIEAATFAPSAGNRQPWRFVVLTDRTVLARMRDVVADASERFADAVDSRVADAFRRYATSFKGFADAPLVIAVLWREATLLGSMVRDAGEAERRRAEDLDRHDGLVSTSMALQNLILAAHARGLGTTVMTGPRLARSALRDLLGVRESWHLLALVPLGHPDEAPEAPPRKAVDRVVRWVGEEG